MEAYLAVLSHQVVLIVEQSSECKKLFIYSNIHLSGPLGSHQNLRGKGVNVEFQLAQELEPALSGGRRGSEWLETLAHWFWKWSRGPSTAGNCVFSVFSLTVKRKAPTETLLLGGSWPGLGLSTLKLAWCPKRTRYQPPSPLTCKMSCLGTYLVV